MASSSTAWTSGATPTGLPPRRRPHVVAAVVAMTVAFVITGGAILAAAGTLSWPNSLAAATPASQPPTVVPIAASDDDDLDIDHHAEGPAEDAPAADPSIPDDEAGPASPPPDLDLPGTPPAEDAVAPDVSDTSKNEPSADGPTSPADGDAADGAGTDDGGPKLTTAEVQAKLREYRFLIGEADGTSGQQTVAAVMAYQRVNGLAVDGVVGPATTAALLAGSAEPSLAGGATDRIEVDLDAQLLHLIEGGERTVTLQVSSGSGGTYTTASGGTARSVTPVGQFTVERRIHGVREAPLGTLYDPLYFHRGFAIHGSPSVPAHPASHGCVRVSRADAAWLIERIPTGMPVHLYGGTHVFTP